MFLGCNGGVLMDYYILLFGTKKDILLLTKQLVKIDDEDVGYDPEAMFKSYASFFWSMLHNPFMLPIRSAIDTYFILLNNSNTGDS